MSNQVVQGTVVQGTVVQGTAPRNQPVQAQMLPGQVDSPHQGQVVQATVVQPADGGKGGVLVGQPIQGIATNNFVVGQGLQGGYRSQPGYGGHDQVTVIHAEGMEPAPDPTCLSAIACFFCCWCFGVIAIMKSGQVAQFNRMGDYISAHEARRQALQWIYITIGTGVLLHIIQLVAR